MAGQRVKSCITVYDIQVTNQRKNMSLDREVNAENTESPYTNGPYLVLSDGSTYDGAEGCVLAYITDTGEQALQECYEFKGVELDDMELITLSDLMDAYNQVHGTNL